jgi:FkbM family methyltransferase
MKQKEKEKESKFKLTILFKKIINNFLSRFGYVIIKNKNQFVHIDSLFKIIIDCNPIIFDVGANKGQSIKLFKNIYPNSFIHSFEPVEEEVKILKNLYQSNDSIILNNVAVGERKERKKFNFNINSAHSSFNSIIQNTTWIKKRSHTEKIEPLNYTLETRYVDIIKLDDYTSANNIKEIDILKIDTQGYESKVLNGCTNLLKTNSIKVIKLELIFSEIYENPLNIYDVEKYLIPNGDKLFAISNAGNLYSNYIFQVDLIYVSNEIYLKFKKN